jgi:hypothetical protein
MSADQHLSGAEQTMPVELLSKALAAVAVWESSRFFSIPAQARFRFKTRD